MGKMQEAMLLNAGVSRFISMMAIAIRVTTPSVTKDWIIESTPVRNLSRISSCTAIQTAARRTIRSLLPMENSSVTQRRYDPKRASTIAAQTLIPTLLPTRSPSSGVNTMYSDVRKAAFPAVVPVSPNCWKIMPKPRGIPLRTPERRDLLISSRSSPLFLKLLAANGIRITVARRYLQKTKAFGPK